MDQFLTLFLLGLAPGALAAALGIGLLVVYRGTGVINFAQSAIAMWGVYVFDEAARSGDLVLPFVGLPARVSLGGPVPTAAAMLVGVASAALLGAMAHLLVLRWMRTSPVLGKVVATVGMMIVLQAIVAQRFGTGSRSISSVLPDGAYEWAGVTVRQDRLLALAAVGLSAVVVAAYFRWSRAGLASRAASECEKGAVLIGLSPDRLALISWSGAAALSTIFAIMLASVTGMSPAFFPLLVVPGLAAALVGRFASVVATAVTGVLIGCLQSGMIQLQSYDWLPEWTGTGLPDVLPLVVISAALVAHGRTLPERGSATAEAQLPPAPAPIHQYRAVAVFLPVAAVLLVTLGSEYRLALIVSMISVVLMLSLVVLTGLLGQISLAQAAFAGAAAFFLSKLADGFGVPFPLAPLLAVAAATGIGMITGIPAVRIRGAQLAVVTLALALAAERVVLRNPALLNEQRLAPVPSPELLGIDLGPLGGDFPRPAFGFAVAGVVAAVVIGVANLRRGITGKRFLAVRSSERAAAASGIDVARTKLVGFAVSSAIAATAGVLFAYLRGQISADGFGTFVGLSTLAIAYLGGITSVSGAVVAGLIANGGLMFTVLNQQVDLGRHYLLLTGVALIVTAVANPQGIALTAPKQLAQLRSRRDRPPTVVT